MNIKTLSILLFILATLIVSNAAFAEDNHTVNADGDACNNANDLMVFNTTKDTFHASVQACAKKCFGQQDCSTKCLVTSLKLTEDCANCFGADILCTEKNCLLDCMSNPNSSKCVECSMKNCEPGLLTCAGVPQDVIPS